jgi:GntR family transcriptional repressor for pyruvate dehydrogenase complex
MSQKQSDNKETIPFEEVKSRRLSDEIFQQIKGLIFRGQLKPGDKLPAERDLANYLNVGRSSLREALIKLNAVGLIEVRKKDGYFIRSLTEQMVGPLKSFIEDEIRNLINFMEVRKMLDIWCVREAIRKGSEEDFERIRQALGEENNVNFHLAVAEATHNVILHHVVSDMHGLFSTIAFIKKRREEYPKLAAIQHKKIYDAMVAKDLSAAEKAVSEHVDFIIKACERESDLSSRGEIE